MKCIQAKKLLENIDRCIKEINGFKSTSGPEKSYFAKFLVVYICGIYEEAIECILKDRMTSLGSKRLSKFFEKYVHRAFRNPDIEKVTGLLGMFDKDWKREINKLPYVVKVSFNNISTNKNALAHGTSCSITLDEVIKYYNNSKTVIQKIDNIVQL